MYNSVLLMVYVVFALVSFQEGEGRLESSLFDHSLRSTQYIAGYSHRLHPGAESPEAQNASQRPLCNFKVVVAVFLLTSK